MSMQEKKLYHVHRPNTGLQQKQSTIQEIKKSYEKVSFSHWQFVQHILDVVKSQHLIVVPF